MIDSGCDPDDPGRETYKGISRRFNPDWIGWEMIDQFKIQFPDFQEFKRAMYHSQKLSNAVYSLYKIKYWDVFAGDEIEDQGMADEMFDTGVNMHPARAVLFLQISLNKLNRNQRLFADLVEDGIFGRKTFGVIPLIEKDDIDILLKMMNVLQGMHYIDNMSESPTQEKYCRGWFKRVSISK